MASNGHDPILTPRDLLLAALRSPEILAGLSLPQWDSLLTLARSAGVLATLALHVERLGLVKTLPPQVVPHIEAARVLAVRHERVVRWEVHEIERALAGMDLPIVLLKGAAYLMAGLNTSRGRLYTDVDLLVPRPMLDDVERALLRQGWEIATIDPRDQRYYRTWLHELPPLRHRRRGTVLDVHYTILPPKDRLCIDASLLIEAAVPVEGTRARVFAPWDMVLHSAAQLFRNGDFRHGLRDLMDLDGMMAEFGATDSFWDRLVGRASQLGLTLPCFCGLRYAERYFRTPIPPRVRAAAEGWRPVRASLRVLDWLVDLALAPRQLDRADPWHSLAVTVLGQWPMPRLRTVTTGLYWTKRLPRLFGREEADVPRAPGGELLPRRQ